MTRRNRLTLAGAASFSIVGSAGSGRVLRGGGGRYRAGLCQLAVRVAQLFLQCRLILGFGIEGQRPAPLEDRFQPPSHRPIGVAEMLVDRIRLAIINPRLGDSPVSI